MKQTIHLILLCAVLTLSECSADRTAAWEELREQANKFYNERQFDEALAIYERAFDDADTDGRLKLRQDIIDCYLAMENAAKARSLLDDQVKAARESGNTYAEAEASFTLGDQLYRAGDHKAGYDYMHEAVRLMEHSDDEDAPSTLAYYHSRLMRYLSNEEDYAAAIEESARLVETAKQIADTASSRIYLRQAYAIGAYLYLQADSLYPPQTKKHLADSAYAAWKELLPCEKVNEEREIAAYFISSGRYPEALDVYKRYERQFVLKTQGYWSMQELVVKSGMAEVYAQMGQADSAYSLLHEAYIIKDTLHCRTAEVNAQELEAVYQNQAKTEQIGRLRLLVAVLALVLAVMITVLSGYYIRTVRRRKDKTIAAVVMDLMNTDSAPAPDSSRFSVFDATVDKGRLFSKPEVTRDVLVELMGTDSTTFSRIIKEQSGCQNLNEYLNRKRIDMACRLLLEHTDWSIDAIAQECGFRSVRTFNHVFKTLRGLPPSAYQQQAQNSDRQGL